MVAGITISGNPFISIDVSGATISGSIISGANFYNVYFGPQLYGASAIQASGSNQANATALSLNYNVITSTINAGACIVPSSFTGLETLIVNATTGTIPVYPPSGAQWNSLGTNTALNIPSGQAGFFYLTSFTQGYSPIFPSGSSSGGGSGFIPPLVIVSGGTNASGSPQAAYNLGAITTVSSITALRAATNATLPAPYVYVLGYYNPGDGGGGTYVSGTSSFDNSGTIITDSSSRSWYLETFSQSIKAANFGVLPSQSTNNAAFSALVNAQSNEVIVEFGPGVYTFTSGLDMNIPASGSITITGKGPDVTVLSFASGSEGIAINYPNWFASVNISELSIVTNGNMNVGNALYLFQVSGFAGSQNAQSNINNITIRGADGYADTYYWNIGLAFLGVRWINVTNTRIYGGGSQTAQSGGSYVTNSSIGVYISGGLSQTPVQFNFIGCGFNYVGYGIQYGPYTEGVIVQNCEFVGGLYGIYIGSSSTNADQLTVIGSNFNVGIQAICDVYGVPNTQIVGNTFLVAVSGAVSSGNGIGVNLAESSFFTIVGNTFQSIAGSPPTNSNNGVVITNATIGGVIEGNEFENIDTAIWLKSSATNVTVGANSYYANYTNILDQGTGNIYVGGLVSAIVLSGSAVSISSSGTSNIAEIMVPNGNWDLTAELWLTTSSGATLSYLEGAISSGSATLPGLPSLSGATTKLVFLPTAQSSNGTVLHVGPASFITSATVTGYLLGSAGIDSGSVSGYGILKARRVGY